MIIAVMGPSGVGKTTLVRSLVRRYTKNTMGDIKGPVTVVSGQSDLFEVMVRRRTDEVGNCRKESKIDDY